MAFDSHYKDSSSTFIANFIYHEIVAILEYTGPMIPTKIPQKQCKIVMIGVPWYSKQCVCHDEIL